MLPTAPGPYLYTAPKAPPLRVEVVRYKEALCVRLPDDDEVELHDVNELLGTWTPA